MSAKGSIRDWMARIDGKLERHNDILADHTRRSLANEEAVELLRQRFDPLEKHVAMWAGAGKVLTVLAGLSVVATLVLKLTGKL